MALAGACIVMSGLALLSFIISLLPRIVSLFERQEIEKPGIEPVAIHEGEMTEPLEISLTDIEQTASAYHPLIEQLPSPFDLKALYVLARENDFPHAHLTIRSFWETGKLVPAGDGLFMWNPLGEAAVVEKLPEAQPPPPPQPAQAAEPAPATPAAPLPAAEAPAAPSEPAAAIEGTPLTAPMPGMVVRYEKQVGEAVSEGETVVILEAMKMENALPAPVSGTVTSIGFASGDTVAKEDVLCVIG